MNEIRMACQGDEYCCGIINFGSFYEETRDFYSRKSPEKFNSGEFEETLMNEVTQQVSGDNDNYGGGYLLTCSLVSNYGKGTGQFDELQDYLLESGWEIVTNFKNRNTGNWVNVFHRFITDEEIKVFNKYFNHDQYVEEEDDGFWGD